MKTTLTLWSLTGLFAAIGSFVAAHGGWGFIRSPFPIELTRIVYRTNVIDVILPRYVDFKPTNPVPYTHPTNASWGVFTNELVYSTNMLKDLSVTNLYITNLLNTTYITNR